MRRSRIRIGKKNSKPLPDKVGVRKTVRNMEGAVIFVGTESEWRKWVKKRDA